MARRKEPFLYISEQFNRIVAKYNALQDRPMDYGNGEELHPAEIHTIEAIGKHPGAHMAELARILGVTRGATQQMVEKLLNKGLVEKFMDESDGKKVYLELTATGNIAFDGHEEYHAELSSYMAEHVDRSRPLEIASLRRFLDGMEFFMEDYRRRKFE